MSFVSIFALLYLAKSRNAVIIMPMMSFLRLPDTCSSPNYAWAVAARFMWGLLNGNIGVAKSYLSEVCDDSNMARGFSTIGLIMVM